MELTLGGPASRLEEFSSICLMNAAESLAKYTTNETSWLV